MSGADDVRLAAQARHAGLAGYLSKSLEPAQMVAAIERVLAGGVFFPDRPRGTAPVFTERQLEVLQHVSIGQSSKVIAHRLGVAERTVKDHLTVIYLRLEAGNRAEAVARAASLGLISLDA